MNYTNPIIQKMYDILCPLVGDLLAQSIIKTQMKTLNLDEGMISSQDVVKLAEGVKKGLVIFVGSDAAQKISNNIATIA
jgi:hypothetical protein